MKPEQKTIVHFDNISRTAILVRQIANLLGSDNWERWIVDFVTEEKKQETSTMNTMKKFTVVCIEHGVATTETWIYHISAISPQHAHEHVTAQFPDRSIVAIFPGWHDEA